MSVTVGVSSEPPETPKSDFAIYVDFDREAPHPQRVFQAVEGLITAFQRLDKTLAGSIDASIEPVLMLEDIESGSIKVWLRNKLLRVDDQPLYELDWRPIVGKYLVAAKWAYIQWVNDQEEHQRPGSLADLRQRFLDLAHETDVHQLPSYGVPSAADILSSTEDVAKALDKLGQTDSAKFISEAGTADFNLDLSWGTLNLTELSVRETISMPAVPMILAVRKPDYLGNTQWEFRHGKRTIRARIVDENWVLQFQARNVDVRPGDALRCMVSQEVKYGYDNELVSETFVVERIEDVLENRYQQSDLFDDDE